MKIELIFTYDDTVVDEKNEQEKEDARKLLEKIRKYGMFNSAGEWIT